MADDRASINSVALRFVGVAAILYGLVHAGLAARWLPEAQPVPEPFFEETLEVAPSGAAGLTVETLEVPANTRRVGVELRIDHEGKGEYSARFAWEGRADRAIEASYWGRNKQASTGLRMNLGTLDVDGASSFRVSVTPPPGGRVLAARIEILADPPDHRLVDTIVDVVIGLLAVAFGIGLVFVARWILRDAERSRGSAT
jgi:hypothetical protein